VVHMYPYVNSESMTACSFPIVDQAPTQVGRRIPRESRRRIDRGHLTSTRGAAGRRMLTWRSLTVQILGSTIPTESSRKMRDVPENWLMMIFIAVFCGPLLSLWSRALHVTQVRGLTC
jgi:hypothetical protein